MSNVAKVYFDLIQKDLKTIDDVPLRWKSTVQELLDSAI
ncbi:CD1375 family protein [Paenibacillus odorifer]